MSGFYCDVPLPARPQIIPAAPIIGATEADLDREGERLQLLVEVSRTSLGRYFARAWDASLCEDVMQVESSSRAGVLAKAVGELRTL